MEVQEKVAITPHVVKVIQFSRTDDVYLPVVFLLLQSQDFAIHRCHLGGYLRNGKSQCLSHYSRVAVTRSQQVIAQLAWQLPLARQWNPWLLLDWVRMPSPSLLATTWVLVAAVMSNQFVICSWKPVGSRVHTPSPSPRNVILSSKMVSLKSHSRPLWLMTTTLDCRFLIRSLFRCESYPVVRTMLNSSQW